MDRIESYIASLSKHVQLEPEELEGFKHEIRSHLRESMRALQQEGYSQDESLNIALQRFGEEEKINAEFRKLYRFQKGVKKSLLLASCLLLMLSVLFVLSSRAQTDRDSNDFDNMLHDYHNNLEGKIADSSITNAEMEAYFKNHKRILRGVALLQTENGQKTTEYAYPSDMSLSNPDSEPYIPFPVENNNPAKKLEFRVDLDRSALFSPLPDMMTVSAKVCFVLYWVLFALWNVFNAQRVGRLNLFWGILFFTLNIAGYLIFLLVERVSVGRLKTAM
ncbi:hypothetical protein PCCS19_07620 [Paenibacillus sp. CCS19]|uniref:permease prefix domain 1-containing protein n=1 Tax=Paenibacillus sp. CCS19 TaxID=3158387 RepID=UPI0025673235|nr:permease prefix domain 1-containing protein [Paenibacillus cellulosilyticus]GMK37708.1 hypothetical protein PCCS19_07620 [Paenibacillus cellulosilyticus]